MAQMPPPPPPPPVYYPPAYQQIEVRQKGPWTAIGWIVLIILILLILGAVGTVVCLGYSCAQLMIPVPIGLYLWKRWIIGRAGI